MQELRPLAEVWEPAKAVPVDGRDRPFICILATGLVLNLVILAYVNAVAFVKQPYSDMFDFLQDLFSGSGRIAAYLWNPHNGQHLVWLRLLTLLDVRLFGGSAIIFAAAALLSLTLAAALSAYILWRALPAPAVAIGAGLLIAMLALSATNATDTTQPINAGYAISFGLAVLAIVLFESPGWPRLKLAPALALPLAVGAMVGSGAGLAIWPVLAFSALRRRRFGMLLIVVVLGAALFGLFWRDSQLITASHPNTPGDSMHVAKMVEYFLLYSGMPWSLASAPWLARLVIGAAAALAGTILALRGASLDGQAGRVRRIGLDLMLFALVTAAMAAAGRVDENAAVVVPARYAVFMTAFDIGLLMVICAHLAQDWPGARRSAGIAASLLALLLVGGQVLAGRGVIHSSQRVREKVAAFDAGRRAPDMTEVIHPDLAFAARVTEECRQRGLYQ
jgi:hypothetical protein